MNEGAILTTILAVGLVIGLVIKVLVDNIIHHVNQIRTIIRKNNEFLAKEEEVRKMRENGDLHEWISMPIMSDNDPNTMLVCKKTGYCPSLDGFIPLDIINTYLNKVKREEEYKIFRNARVADLAKDLNLSVNKMEEIVEKIFAIKKDFALTKLSELQQDLEKRAVDVEQQS